MCLTEKTKMFSVHGFFVILLLFFCWSLDAQSLSKPPLSVRSHPHPESKSTTTHDVSLPSTKKVEEDGKLTESMAARTAESPRKIQRDNLIFASIVFRSFDRNPLASYPTSLYSDESHWPRGYGQLSRTGIHQGHNLGSYLGDRYRYSLLKKIPNDVAYIQSSNEDRTLMSASAVANGMFDSVAAREKKHGTPEPIAIHSMPNHQLDYLFTALCPRYDDAMKKYLNSPKHVQQMEKHKISLDILSNNSGISFEKPNELKTFDELHKLYDTLDTLWIENKRKKDLPEWAPEDIFEPRSDMENMANYVLKLGTSSPELARLSSGFLIRDMLDRFNESQQHPETGRSILLYAGHDSTIANLLNSLGLFEPRRPKYGASIHFEVYKTAKGETYIQITYRNGKRNVALKIPKCSRECSLDEFKSLYNDIIPTGDFDKECELTSTSTTQQEKQFCTSSYVVLALCILAIVLAVAYIVWKKWIQKRKTNDLAN